MIGYNKSVIIRKECKIIVNKKFIMKQVSYVKTILKFKK